MYNVSYDEASGVCTVSETEREDNPRPWTGKMIREVEGAIIVLCALAVCGLLVRVVRLSAQPCLTSMLSRSLVAIDFIDASARM